MKRICIYVTYDLENIVDDYVGYMLQALRRVVDCLVVVCNYTYISRGFENVQPYADKIYYRENIGFDAGAYKDALCKYLGWEQVYEYDELLLVNDSFYGPLYPFEDLFDRMGVIAADYWGITRSPEGIFRGSYVYDTHIQSYFLVFRKKILHSDCFRRFWIDMKYPESIFDAIILFELNGNRSFAEWGFRGSALEDQWELSDAYVREKENPYLLYPFELISEAGIPVLKRKSLDLRNKGFGNALRAFRYIEETGIYDTGLIKKHFLRIGRLLQAWEGMNYWGLDEFYDSCSKIFFYGGGVYGKNLAEYFFYRGWTFEGFLVTDTEQQSQECIPFDEAAISENDGIIITVGNKKMFQEIKELIETRYSVNQIYLMAGESGRRQCKQNVQENK